MGVSRLAHAAASLVLLHLIPASASAFNIASYCQDVSEAVGGSYQIELACRQQEEAARSRLNVMDIPERVRNYCTEVAQAVGGSYQIMVACVEQELEAKSRLQ